jgi:preprotein translocase subunit SecG
MGFLITLLILAYVAACGFLIFVILLQSGKGGGLSGLLSGGGGLSDSFGASGTEKTLNRWTTYCAIAFLVISLALTLLGARHFQKSLIGEIASEERSQQPPAQVTPAEVTPRSEVTSPGSPEVPAPVQIQPEESAPVTPAPSPGGEETP